MWLLHTGQVLLHKALLFTNILSHTWKTGWDRLIGAEARSAAGGGEHLSWLSMGLACPNVESFLTTFFTAWLRGSCSALSMLLGCPGDFGVYTPVLSHSRFKIGTSPEEGNFRSGLD